MDNQNTKEGNASIAIKNVLILVLMDNQNTPEGCWAESYEPVLILVLMDNQNTKINLYKSGIVHRLNPCSNG